MCFVSFFFFALLWSGRKVKKKERKTKDRAFAKLRRTYKFLFIMKKLRFKFKDMFVMLLQFSCLRKNVFEIDKQRCTKEGNIRKASLSQLLLFFILNNFSVAFSGCFLGAYRERNFWGNDIFLLLLPIKQNSRKIESLNNFFYLLWERKVEDLT